MNNTYTTDTGYLGKSCGTQSKEQHYCTFSNLVIKGKLRKAIRFVCKRETGRVFQPDDLASDKTGVVNETVTSILAGKHPRKNNSVCSTLDSYKEIYIFIPVDITEDVVKSVTWKILRSSVPGGMDPEYLQGLLLNFEEDSKRICGSV